MMDNHQYKINQLKHMLEDSDLWDDLKDCKAMIAGGAITSLFSGMPVNDLDIYFKDADNFHRFLRGIYGLDESINSGIHSCRVTFSTKKSVLCKTGILGSGPLVQLIALRPYKDTDELFDSFDFYHNMGAYDFEQDKIILHPRFMDCVARRAIEFNPNTPYPMVSALRVQKYKERGYSISKAQMLRILMSIAKKNFKTWDDVKDEVGSFYGISEDDIFDETKEFSLDEAISQLIGKELNDDAPNSDIEYEEVTEKLLPNMTMNTNAYSWYSLRQKNYICPWEDYEENVDYLAKMKEFEQ